MPCYWLPCTLILADMGRSISSPPAAACPFSQVPSLCHVAVRYACRYFYFGDASSPLVTANLAADSVFSGRALLGVITVDRLLAALILVSCFAKYPVLVMVIQVCPGAAI